MQMIVFIMCIISILFFIFEKEKKNGNRKKLKYVIHVNGIRGKSTVCRLIDAGLRAGGYKVFTKVTGTSPRILDTDGNELLIDRLGKANIREQIKIIKDAQQHGADVLVVECMAVRPEYQKISEEDILKADICVITNVRMDHIEEMGEDTEEIARSLSNTIPQNGILITSDEEHSPLFEAKCKKNGTELFVCKGEETYGEIDFPQNVAVALKACECAGVAKEKALLGMKNYRPDPGKYSSIRFINKDNKNIVFFNALAANDPDSTDIIYKDIFVKKYTGYKKYLFIIARSDRINRSVQFLEFAKIKERSFDKIVIFGEDSKLLMKKAVQKSIPKEKVEIYDGIRYFDNIKDDTALFAVGNICGKGMELIELLKKKEKRKETVLS